MILRQQLHGRISEQTRDGEETTRGKARGSQGGDLSVSVGANVHRNGSQIVRQIGQAKKKNADMVHFPVTALTGYA